MLDKIKNSINYIYLKIIITMDKRSLISVYFFALYYVYSLILLMMIFCLNFFTIFLQIFLVINKRLNYNVGFPII